MHGYLQELYLLNTTQQFILNLVSNTEGKSLIVKLDPDR